MRGEAGLPVFVVNVVPESFGVNQGHSDPDSILFELCDRRISCLSSTMIPTILLNRKDRKWC
jgi:hypothetical protein